MIFRMIITQINDVKWLCATMVTNSVSELMAFETTVFYLILNHIKDDCLPNYKHKINLNDLIDNDVCGVLLMKNNVPLLSALKATCLNFLKSNAHAPEVSIWSQVLKAIKSTNSLQTYANGFILKRSFKYQLRVTAIISKRQTKQFLEEKVNESIRNSFIYLKNICITFEFSIFHDNGTKVNSVSNHICEFFLFYG